jgi:hypothetical protein
MGPRRIAQVRTTGGVFQDVGRTPRCAGRAPVPSIFHKFQLKLEEFQHFVSILCHISPVAIQGMFAERHWGCDDAGHVILCPGSQVWVGAPVTRAHGLRSSWPVRARRPLLPLPTDYSANAIHIFAPNNMLGCQCQRPARGNSPEHQETTREMENSMRCGRARSSQETVHLQVVRRTLGTTAKINCRTRVTLAN